MKTSFYKMGFSFLYSLMRIKELYKLFLKYPSISTDSRKIIPKSIFFALQGENFDGNNFASKALESGSAIAVVDNPDVVVNDRYFLVENVLSALQLLGKEHRKNLGLPILGITGTNGKTTTKELIATVLSKKYNTCYTQGNFNNHIGVPLTLLRMTSKTEIGIVEMGANHPGEIASLCKIASPDLGLITNIGKAHLEGFGSFEGIKNTKAELYRSVEQIRGKLFINQDNKILTELVDKGTEKITYGKSNAFLKGRIIDSGPFLTLDIILPTGEVQIKTKLIGQYNFENVLAAACVGKYFSVKPEDIKDAIETYIPSNNRSQLIMKGSNQIIMDAYNANPTSMKASINNFLSLNSTSRIVILGDMLELGNYSLTEHQSVVDLLKANNIDLTLLVGENFKATTHPTSMKCFKNTDLLIDHLKENPIHKSHILIKGSRGIRLEKVLEVI